jgi:hypothetical protein
MGSSVSDMSSNAGCDARSDFAGVRRDRALRATLVKNRSSLHDFMRMLLSTERRRRLIVPRVFQPFFALALAFEDCLLLYFARIFERRLNP